MSTENLNTFFSQVGNDPALAAKIAATEPLGREEKAAALAQLSEEAGTPFTAEEILAFFATPLSDEELSGIAGGGRGAPNNCSHEENARRKERFNQFFEDVWEANKKATSIASYASGIGLVSKLFP